MPNETQHQDDNRTMAEQDEFARAEAINSLDRTGETPFLPAAPATQPLPAYAPPLVAHHPEPRIKGGRWVAVAAVTLGLVVGAAALRDRPQRVSSVGLLGTGSKVVEEVVATAPPAEAPREAIEALPEEQPDTTPSPEGKFSDAPGGNTPSITETPTEEDASSTYSFSWPDEQGGQGYGLEVPADPESDGGTYSFSWPDEQDPRHGHEFSYRHEGDSYTFEYDGQGYTLDLEDLEWLLGEGGSQDYGRDSGQGYGQDDASSYDYPGDLGGFGDLQMPEFGGGSPGDHMPGYGDWGGPW